MRYVLHLFISFSLVFIGEYSSLIVLQFAFIFTFFQSKNICYFFYFSIIFFALVKIFASSLYFLYFLNLLFLFYYLYKQELLLNVNELVIFTLYMAMLYGMYYYFEEDIYNLTIRLEIDDKVNHVFDEVVGVLALMHIFIFMILGYNKQKIFRM